MAPSHRVDVLVLGSGIAGLFYALKVADGASVAIVTKKRAADSATNHAQGGIASVKSSEDSFAAHAQDTLTAGAGLCDPQVVDYVVERGPAMIDALPKLGATVRERPDGLTVTPPAGGAAGTGGASISTYEDHRMAMSFAVAGLAIPGVRIENPGCVDKTYPRFFEDLAAGLDIE